MEVKCYQKRFIGLFNFQVMPAGIKQLESSFHIRQTDPAIFLSLLQTGFPGILYSKQERSI